MIRFTHGSVGQLMSAAAACACTLMVALALLPSRVSAAAVPAGQTHELDEILVQGSRARLVEMRKELVKLEDRFYAQYNDLNTVKDFDIHCVREARTGTRIIRRTCRAVYEDEAIAQEGQDALRIRQYLEPQLQTYKYQDLPDPKQPYDAPAPPLFAILARLPDFQKNLQQVVAKNPELLNVLRERSQLTRQYEALRRQIFSSKRDSGDDATATAEDQATPEGPAAP